MKRTDKTLLEQMQISDVEIFRRMELLDLNKNADEKIYLAKKEKGSQIYT